MKIKQPFTKQEQEIMDSLVDAHNKFVAMEQMHPDDTKEWVDGIHKCQNVLMRRIVARDYPDVFYTQKPKQKNKPKSPTPPLGRVVKTGVGVFCNVCGSTKSKHLFFGLIGSRYCDNSACSCIPYL